MGLTEQEIKQNPFQEEYKTYNNKYTKSIIAPSKNVSKEYILLKESGLCFYIRIFYKQRSNFKEIIDWNIERHLHLKLSDFKEITVYDTPQLKVWGKEALDKSDDKETKYFGYYEHEKLKFIVECRSDYIGVIGDTKAYEKYLLEAKEEVVVINSVLKNPKNENPSIKIISIFSLIVFIVFVTSIKIKSKNQERK